jgi:hypothetical protein
MRHRATALVSAFGLAMGAVACGDGGGVSTAQVVPSTTSAPSTTPTVAPTTTTTATPTTTTTAAPRRTTTTAATRPTTTTTVAAVTATCHPSYSGACLPPDASDVDCAGGNGNGPEYTSAEDIRVVGPDEYGLDHDNDGYGCES